MGCRSFIASFRSIGQTRSVADWYFQTLDRPEPSGKNEAEAIHPVMLCRENREF